MAGLFRHAGWSVLTVAVAAGMWAIERPTPVGATPPPPPVQTEPPDGEDLDPSDLPPLQSEPPAPPPSNPGAAMPPLPAVPSPGPVAATVATAAGWVPLGGRYVLDPTVLSTGDVVFSVTAGRSDVGGRPFYHERTGGSWSRPISLGGFLPSIVAPAEPLLEPQKADWEIFGVGGDEAVWYRTRSTGWQSLGGVLRNNPTAATWHGVTYVFGIGLDGAVWYRSTTSGWHSLGGRLVSDLAVTTDGTSLYVLGVGEDGALWSQRLSGQTWTGWQSLGGEVGRFYPTTTYLSSTGYVFITGTDDGVWYQGVTGGTWSGWYTIGGQTVRAPAPIARADGLDVFVVGSDDAMYSQRYGPSGWSGWRADGGGFVSNPAANTSHVVGIGFDNQLWARAIS